MTRIQSVAIAGRTAIALRARTITCSCSLWSMAQRR